MGLPDQFELVLHGPVKGKKRPGTRAQSLLRAVSRRPTVTQKSRKRMTAGVRPEAAFYPATTGRTGGYGLGGTGLHDAGRPVSLPFRIQQPRYQRAIPLALHCAKELSHSAAPQQQHLLPELQRAATRDHSGGPCPAGSFGGMFPRRSAEAGPRGLQSLFSAMVKRPNCKRQIVEDEFIRSGRDVNPAGPGDSAAVCRTGDRAAG